jgi:hypothetical protein
MNAGGWSGFECIDKGLSFQVLHGLTVFPGSTLPRIPLLLLKEDDFCNMNSTWTPNSSSNGMPPLQPATEPGRSLSSPSSAPVTCF